MYVRMWTLGCVSLKLAADTNQHTQHSAYTVYIQTAYTQRKRERESRPVNYKYMKSEKWMKLRRSFEVDSENEYNSETIIIRQI